MSEMLAMAGIAGATLISLGMLVTTIKLFKRDEFAGIICLVLTVMVIVCSLATITDIAR